MQLARASFMANAEAHGRQAQRDLWRARMLAADELATSVEAVILNADAVTEWRGFIVDARRHRVFALLRAASGSGPFEDLERTVRSLADHVVDVDRVTEVVSEYEHDIDAHLRVLESILIEMKADDDATPSDFLATALPISQVTERSVALVARALDASGQVAIHDWLGSLTSPRVYGVSPVQWCFDSMTDDEMTGAEDVEFASLFGRYVERRAALRARLLIVSERVEMDHDDPEELVDLC